MNNMKILIAIGATWLFTGNPCSAGDNILSASIPSTKFVSENSKYTVTINYEKFGGTGKATYLIGNEKGESLGFLLPTCLRAWSISQMQVID